MYIFGDFINQQGQRIAVHILTDGDRTDTREIGTDEAGLYFTADEAVTTESSVSDTFDVLLRQSATIRLLSAAHTPELYSTTCRNTVVNILRDGVLVFAGFLEPQTYSQPYNETLDEIELNCVDALSALQYSNYQNIGAAGVNYSTVKGSEDMRTFAALITSILDGVTADLDITGTQTAAYLYDQSKGTDSTAEGRRKVFDRIAVSGLLFLGDTEDDVWTQDTVLEEVLRYCNLHILQSGLTFYLFDWDTLRQGETVTWYDLKTAAVYSWNTTPQAITLTAANVADTDTQISINDTYNRIELTDSVTEMDSVVESPLSSDSIENYFHSNELWMTEYQACGDGKRSAKAFWSMTHNGTDDWNGNTATDWYMRLRRNPDWTFHVYGSTDDIYTHLYGSTYDDEAYGKGAAVVSRFLGKNMAAVLMSVGSVKTNTQKDNSPTAKVSMTDNLVISVNGNGKDKQGEAYPSADDIFKHIPLATYNGAASGGVFSPADSETTNYIVISGNITLNPIMETTANFWNVWRAKSYAAFMNWADPKSMVKTVPDRNNSDGRRYTRQYWKRAQKLGDFDTIVPPLQRDGASKWYWQTDWGEDPTAGTDVGAAYSDHGFYPYTGEGPQYYQYKYTKITGDKSDQLSKLPILCCMLIIGDKCVVEKQPGQTLGTDTKGTGNGEITDFVWQTYKTREECSSDEEYYAQSFTIGINPKIDDYIIGTEYEIQNNIDVTLNLDTEGTAIPIRKADKVKGRVKFQILGVVNVEWDMFAQYRETFWEGSTLTDFIPLMAHVSSIWMKSFEVNIVSDNGGLADSDTDSDIVYISDTDESFANVNDDTEFKITTALTAAECLALGVNSGAWLSAPERTDTGEALAQIYDHYSGETAKPEQLYVDAYWQEWHAPRIVMEQSMTDTGGVVLPFNLYTHQALGKTFHVQGIDRDLTAATAKMTLKEIAE